MKPARPVGTCKTCGRTARLKRRGWRRNYRREWQTYCNRCDRARRGRGRGRAVTDLLAGMKTKRVCADCGGRFHPAAMEFDHLPSTQKRFILARASHRGMGAVLAELQKCELVCANCHRERTVARRKLGATRFDPGEMTEHQQELLFTG